MSPTLCAGRPMVCVLLPGSFTHALQAGVQLASGPTIEPPIRTGFVESRAVVVIESFCKPLSGPGR